MLWLQNKKQVIVLQLKTMTIMKRKNKQRLTLSIFKDKHDSTGNSLELYTDQVIAYGSNLLIGGNSGAPGGGVNIRIRGQGSLNT